ncbi:type III-B CRISPR-associated protein Cas10/Cmr2 [Roseospira navarrensis]|uniref:Type III-B CRISPR-associated protein Cas10/Cmr2 n=1 Tax=Roseospira navarrensis TaxID=140058 RepID=A0A7X1ZFF7_9PROT|nr:type III-B CRISPR-associated protein Cas10/Cmr2 [Roseospira navarrensis]MQX37565.1 type III-B CRISPR-associated protein Cas10/Cmr2 [Roseospira navarrensis]
MNAFQFWQQKIIQVFHDPPAKPFGGIPKVSGGLKSITERLFDLFQEHIQGRKWRHRYKAADWAASGADRPMLYVPKKKGVSGLGSVRWPNQPVISHPLAPGRLLELSGAASTDRGETPALEDALEDAQGQPRDLIDEQEDVARDLAVLVRLSFDEKDLHYAFIVPWRRYRDDLMARFPNDPLWQEPPAESRSPDHSIWDHLKVTTALAFMQPHTWKEPPRDLDTPREPWMLRVSLGPVGRFIGQARTSRDLWIGSFLLADLAWHAMQRIVEQYGPDCIVYPDLRANPRADVWLAGAYPEALPEQGKEPATYAAVLPDAFVALVPRGGAGHLMTLEELARQCQERVEARWAALHGCVKTWIRNRVRPDGTAWESIWDRQTARCPIHVTWTAVPWRPMERIEEAESLRGRALPNQPARLPIRTADHAAIAARRARLSPWVAPEVWAHYEQARDVYAHANLDLHQMERGFDYALTHHMLGVRHALREAAHPAPIPDDEPGEKCTLCGEREALHGGPSGPLPLWQARKHGRDFWRVKDLDRDETGEERLCAVCTTKRFLIDADQSRVPQKSLLGVVWAGSSGIQAGDGSARDRDGRLRVPFPSTATVAAQGFLEATFGEPRLHTALEALAEACRTAALPRTSFPRTLPRLAAVYHDAPAPVRALLEYEAEDMLFPEVLDGKARTFEANGDLAKKERHQALAKAVSAFRQAAAAMDIPAPTTRIAVLHLDGDNMGKLLVGEADAIAARWRDVLHPQVIDRLGRNGHLKAAGWGDLLDAKRLMGPSVHAFISRALGQFSHRIVPWVVEQEFSGVLIYAGGDDVLCLAPADEAIPLAARLHQLFSAAWVVDTLPHQQVWAWRRPGWRGEDDQTEARKRFLIPRADGPGAPIRLGVPGQRVARHVSEDTDPPAMDVRGLLLPMLGSGASLSAGVAIGHYKTPLSVMLSRASDLETMAKAQGRSAIALGHASRGGVKTGFSLPWGVADADEPPTAAATLTQVIKAFRKGTLPGRLPYKLRDISASVNDALDVIGRSGQSGKDRQAAEQTLLHGMFRSCLEGSVPDSVKKAAEELWLRGVTVARACPDADGSVHPEHFADGLLVCRELARGESAGEAEA